MPAAGYRHEREKGTTPEGGVLLGMWPRDLLVPWHTLLLGFHDLSTAVESSLVVCVCPSRRSRSGGEVGTTFARRDVRLDLAEEATHRGQHRRLFLLCLDAHLSVPLLLHLLQDDGLPLGVTGDHLPQLVHPREVDLTEIRISADRRIALRHL